MNKIADQFQQVTVNLSEQPDILAIAPPALRSVGDGHGRVVVRLVVDIRLSTRNANQVRSEALQDQLRPLVTTIELAIPKTRELAERKFTSEGYPEDERLATEALDELRETVRTLPPPVLGHE